MNRDWKTNADYQYKKERAGVRIPHLNLNSEDDADSIVNHKRKQNGNNKGENSARSTDTSVSWGSTASSFSVASRNKSDINNHSKLTSLKVNNVPRYDEMESNEQYQQPTRAINIEEEWQQMILQREKYRGNCPMRHQDLETYRKRIALAEDAVLDHLGRSKQSTQIKTGPAGRQSAAYSRNEYLSTNRVRFNASLRTSHSQESLRDLTGFFFHDDNTLVVFEFRHVGKVLKTLPYLNRDTFIAAWGRRKGQPYLLFDIFTDNILFISSGNGQVMKLVIGEIDEEARREILQYQLRPDQRLLTTIEWRQLSNKFEYFHYPIDPKIYLKLLRLQDRIQSIVRKGNPLKIWIELFVRYSEICDTKTRSASRDVMEATLSRVGLKLTFAELDTVWSVLNPMWNSASLEDDESVNGEGVEAEDEIRNNLPKVFDFTDYIRTILGEMNETRRSCIRRTFQTMDINKTGSLSKLDIRRYYHKPISNVLNQLEGNFINFQWDEIEKYLFFNSNDVVTYIEFEIFYEAISMCLRQDADFIAFIYASWSV